MKLSWTVQAGTPAEGGRPALHFAFTPDAVRAAMSLVAGVSSADVAAEVEALAVTPLLTAAAQAYRQDETQLRAVRVLEEESKYRRTLALAEAKIAELEAARTRVELEAAPNFGAELAKLAKKLEALTAERGDAAAALERLGPMTQGVEATLDQARQAALAGAAPAIAVTLADRRDKLLAKLPSALGPILTEAAVLQRALDAIARPVGFKDALMNEVAAPAASK